MNKVGNTGNEEVEEVVGVGGEDDAVGAELGSSGNLGTNSMMENCRLSMVSHAST